MNKKILMLILLFTIIVSPVVVKASEKVNPISKKYNVMHTTIVVDIYNEPEEVVNPLLAEIGEMFTALNNLTDNFKKYDINGASNSDSEFDEDQVLNNIAYINENIETEIEVDKRLYDLLKISEEYYIETNGYFDVSIGHIVDKWKTLINSKPEEKLSDNEFNDFLADVKAIPVIRDGIILTEDSDKYFVRIKDGVKIDLGAIAKGYIVQLATNLLKDNNIEYYSVGGSDSSLAYGMNPNREGEVFNIGIQSPKKDELYADIVGVKNTSVGTSGDTVQYYMHNGVKYHHIVSPISKIPENFRSLITLIGPDAGKIDALTTALMSMDDETLSKWEEANPEYIVYNLKTDVIEEDRNYLLLSIIIGAIIVSAGVLVIFSIKSKKGDTNEKES